MWSTLDLGYWSVLPLAIPADESLVRLFMIQHDSGRDLFRHRRANDWTGRIIGVLTLTPLWFSAAILMLMRHANSGNLDRVAFATSAPLRWAEYRHALGLGAGCAIVSTGTHWSCIGPAYLFILQYRLPVGMMRGRWQPGPAPSEQI